MTTLYWQDDDTGATEFVAFDAVMTEGHEDVMTITEHPVEQGANVTDHAREEPTRLTVEGFVSGMPTLADDDARFESVPLTVETMADPGTKTIQLDVPGAPIQPSVSGLLQAGIGAISNAITGGPNHKATVRGDPRRTTVARRAQMLRQSSPRNRVRHVYDLLLKAQSRKLLVTAQTGVREHFDMLIERVAAPRTTADGTGAKFQVDLKRIRVAASETVQSPQPAELRGQLTKKAGSQTVKNAADPEPRRSILKSAVSSF
jgi:hypothetical protein